MDKKDKDRKVEVNESVCAQGRQATWLGTEGSFEINLFILPAETQDVLQIEVCKPSARMKYFKNHHQKISYIFTMEWEHLYGRGISRKVISMKSKQPRPVE